MKIALLSRPDKAVRADTTSSRPRVIYDLAKGLTDLGHDVTTFGSGDSEVSGTLRAVCPIAVEKMPPAENRDYLKYSYTVSMIEQAVERSGEFDIIHNHVYPEFIPLLATSRFKAPLVTTIHTQIVPHINETMQYFQNSSFVALSENQRKIGTHVNYIATVYNGIAIDQFPYSDIADDYLLFFGRMKVYKDESGREIDPKGVTKAIQVAEKSGERLLIAGNIEDPKFFDERIKPHLNDKIQFVGPVSAIGPITFEQKIQLFSKAKALLNPIDWEEPFGLVMAEAMACGTPVVSFSRGAAPEIIEHGKSGFLCASVDEMSELVAQIENLNRADCRERIEKMFTVSRMAEGYEKVYQDILALGKK